MDSDVCPLFFNLGTGDSLAQAFRKAGFRDVHMRTISTRLKYSSGEEACAAAFAGGPVALAYSRFDEPTREAAHAEYLQSIEPYKTATGYDLPGEFVIVRGTAT